MGSGRSCWSGPLPNSHGDKSEAHEKRPQPATMTEGYHRSLLGTYIILIEQMVYSILPCQT